MTDTHTPSAETPAAAQSETTDVQLPRFIVGVLRYEDFLKAIQLSGVRANERITHYQAIMKNCKELLDAAQTYDFMSIVPDFDGTEEMDRAGARLAAELHNQSVPEEVRAIYWDLYSGDVGRYIDPGVGQ